MQRSMVINNVKAYKIMYNIERCLRVFISKILQENFEDGWLKGIPIDVIKKCEKRALRERDTYQETVMEDCKLIINYADFKDLKDIIIKNWSFFEPYFIRKELIEYKLGELEIPRNIIAHNRIISNTELSRITVYKNDLERCMLKDVLNK